MNEFEKVEELRQKANVSYEEAREALREANGDLLDAMVILEQQGKVKAAVNENENKKKTCNDDGFFKKAGRGIRRFIKYSSENYMQMKHKEEAVLRIPLWIAILLMIMFWEPLLVIIVISLFCGCSYHVVGEEKSEKINTIME